MDHRRPDRFGRGAGGRTRTSRVSPRLREAARLPDAPSLKVVRRRRPRFARGFAARLRRGVGPLQAATRGAAGEDQWMSGGDACLASRARAAATLKTLLDGFAATARMHDLDSPRCVCVCVWLGCGLAGAGSLGLDLACQRLAAMLCFVERRASCVPTAAFSGLGRELVAVDIPRGAANLSVARPAYHWARARAGAAGAPTGRQWLADLCAARMQCMWAQAVACEPAYRSWRPRIAKKETTHHRHRIHRRITDMRLATTQAPPHTRTSQDS